MYNKNLILMKKIIYVFCCLFPYLLLGQKVNISYIDSVFQKEFQNQKFNGHVIVSQHDSIIYDRFFGKANYEKNIPFSDKTIFQIASISKQFTASAILILEQQGKLKLEDKVQKYLPKFPYSDVKIIHLLNHTSGMPNFSETMLNDLDHQKVNGNKELIQMLQTQKYLQQTSAGEKWEYCDIAYCVAATLVENISKMSFRRFMKKYIFKPAHMTNTTAEFYTDTRFVFNTNICEGYELDQQTHTRKIAYEQPHNNYVCTLGGFYGDGSVYTTAYDLLKWDKALYTDEILTSSSKQKLFTPTKLNDGTYAKDLDYNYGLGWYVGENQSVGEFYFHPGGQAGYCAKFIRCPKQKVTIVILSNLSHIDFYTFTNIYPHIFE